MRHAASLVLLVLIAGALSACDSESAYRDSFAFSPAPRAMSAAGAPVVLATDSTFDRELAAANAGGASVALHFTAKWCGPCRAMAPTLDSMAAERAGRLRVIRVDVDESPATAKRYGVRALPALLLVQHGVVTKRIVGYQSRENLAVALASMP